MMANQSGNYGAYKRVSVETASQGKLIAMLFNGAIHRAREAKDQLANNDVAAVHNNLVKAQAIIAELRRALDMEQGEIAQNVDQIYEYFEHLLIQANIRKDPEPIEECVALMIEMRDTWSQAFAIAEKEQGNPQWQSSAGDSGGQAAVNFEG